MHLTSIPTCMNFLSRFQSIKFFDYHIVQNKYLLIASILIFTKIFIKITKTEKITTLKNFMLLNFFSLTALCHFYLSSLVSLSLFPFSSSFSSPDMIPLRPQWSERRENPHSSSSRRRRRRRRRSKKRTVTIQLCILRYWFHHWVRDIHHCQFHS